MANNLNLGIRIQVNADGSAQVLSQTAQQMNALASSASAASQRMTAGMSSAASSSQLAARAMQSSSSSMTAGMSSAASSAQIAAAAIANSLRSASNVGRASMQSMTESMLMNLETMNARMAVMNGHLSASQASGGRLARSNAGLTGSFVLLQNPVARVIAAMYTLSKVLVEPISEIQKMNLRLESLTKSSADYASVQTYLSDVSKAHHKDQLQLSDSFSRLLALEQTGLLTREKSKAILEGLSNAQSKLGVSNDDIALSMRGMSQALSQGTLQWEEVKQVTEPVPGLMNKIATAAGFVGETAVGDFKKLVESGHYTSKMFADVIPSALAEYQGAAAKSGNLIVSKFQDIKNAWSDLKRLLEAPVASSLNPILEVVNASLTGIVNGIKYLKSLDAIGAQGMRAPGYVAPEKSSTFNDLLSQPFTTAPKPLQLVDAQKDAILVGQDYIRYLNTVEDADKRIANAEKEAEKATKKASDAEQERQKSVIDTLNGLQSEIEVNRLGEKERAREVEMRRSLARAVGDEIPLVKSLVNQKYDEIDAQNKLAQALKRVNEAQDKMLEQQYALDNMALDTQFAEKDLQMAKTLKAMGAENEYIKQRLDLEQQVRALQLDNPSLSESAIRDAVVSRQKVIDELAQYTNAKTDESAKWMEAAFKKAAENIQDSFATMFENMLNGDATASFAKFADNIRITLNKAISQQLALDLQGLFGENGSIANVLKSGLLFAVAAIPSFFKKSAATVTPSAAMDYNGNGSPGLGAMDIADTFGRTQGIAYQNQTLILFNKNLDALASGIMTGIKGGIDQFGAQLASSSVVQTVSNFMRPITDVVSGIYNATAEFISSSFGSIVDAIGLGASSFVDTVSSAWSAGIASLQKTAAWGAQAAESGAEKFAASAFKAAGQTLAVISAIYTTFTYFSGLGDMIKRGNVVEMVSSTGMMIGSIVAMIPGFQVIGGIVMAVSALVGLFSKTRVPNAWMNTYNPDNSGNPLQNPSALGTYNADVGKSAYVGEFTPFGATVISTHEMNLSIDQMNSAFGELLKTVKTVDINLYNAVNNMDAKFGEAGRTMDYYNHALVGDNRIATQQNASDLNTGNMLSSRYDWIVNQLAASGSQVGQYINAWFDVITNKFISVSQDNAMFVLGVIDSLAANIENFMALPLGLVNLIGNSVKSVNAGGTPSSVMDEIAGVLNTYTMVSAGLKQLNIAVDDNRVVSFLANINAIGYGVKDAGINLLAAGIALQKSSDDIAAVGDTLMNAVEAKLNALKSQGFDSSQVNAYFGSFGLFGNLFAEAKVAFTAGDLDLAAQNIHKLSQASVEVAKNTIDHAIANEHLTDVTRAAAIATLVKTGKLEQATVAEAEYGVSIQTNTKAVLEQMAFIQQMGAVTGQTLGDMGVSADTWQQAAANIVTVFGSLSDALKSFDNVAKTFLSGTDYAQYNLDTINNSLASMRGANPGIDLAGLNRDSIAAALKSSGTMAGFIAAMAQGDGSTAKTIMDYVVLIGQKISAEKAYSDAVAEAGKVISDATDQILADANKALDGAFNSLSDSINAQKNLAQTHFDAIKTVSDNIKAALGSTVVESDVLNAKRRRDAQAVIAAAAISAKAGGSLVGFAGLDEALKTVAKPSEQFFKTFTDYARDQARTAANLSVLQTESDKQVSTAQATLNSLNDQLTAAKTQVDLLRGIDSSIKDLATSKTLFNDAVSAVKAAGASNGVLSSALPVALTATTTTTTTAAANSSATVATASGLSDAMAKTITSLNNLSALLFGEKTGLNIATLAAISSLRTLEAANNHVTPLLYGEKTGLNIATLAAISSIRKLEAANNHITPLLYGEKTGLNIATLAAISSLRKLEAANNAVSPLISGGKSSLNISVNGAISATQNMSAAMNRVSASIAAMTGQGANNSSPSNAELIAEIKALRAEIAALRASSDKTASNTGLTATLLRNVTRDGQSVKTSAA